MMAEEGTRAGQQTARLVASGSTPPMVLSQGVHKRFGRTEVLKGIDLEVPRGTVCCVIGPSGSGKSTFLRCINHLEKIEAGRLTVDGQLVGYAEHGGRLHELREREVARRRRDIGMVFQHFNLFPHLTARENIMEAPLRRPAHAAGRGTAPGRRVAVAGGPGRPG